jgi:hypothetical protein
MDGYLKSMHSCLKNNETKIVWQTHVLIVSEIEVEKTCVSYSW